MSKHPPIHLCIQQPAGYVHSLGLLDQARYFRYQFRRLGLSVTLAKNRLRHDAVNFVFGAHLGFDAAQRERHACIFVNLEQLGEGGAAVSAHYLNLLASSAVVDYNDDNRAAYAADVTDVPVVPLLHAPYLKPEQTIPLEERPIDLLFIGSMNERRRAWLDRIEALGLSVATFDGPLYGPERDQFILQAKAVVNAHFYESSRFEQARVAHCLSLGTPVIAERTARTDPHPAFEDCVLWLEGEQLEQFFSEDFGTPEYYQVARAALERFEQADPIEAYADLVGFAAGFGRAHHERRAAQAWQPECINLVAGNHYKPGWFNLDLKASAEPDLVLDLGECLVLPLVAQSPATGPVLLTEASVDVIDAGDLPARARDLPALLGNCLRLLRVGGELRIDVPLAGGALAGQDLSHVRALNENAWFACTEGFWQLGWLESRFDLSQFGYFDAAARPCAREQAVGMHVVLCKVETSLRERTNARTLHATLALPDDAIEPTRHAQPRAAVYAPNLVMSPATPMPTIPAMPAAAETPTMPAVAEGALALLRRLPQAAASCR